MPAWSVPTTHNASLPFSRAWRTSTSCNVLSSACPMCSEPVTLGGGLTIVHGSAPGRSGRNSPSLSQCAYQRNSISAGSKVFGSSLMDRACSHSVLQAEGSPRRASRRCNCRRRYNGRPIHPLPRRRHRAADPASVAPHQLSVMADVRDPAGGAVRRKKPGL